jgi:hypothetical protein
MMKKSFIILTNLLFLSFPLFSQSLVMPGILPSETVAPDSNTFSSSPAGDHRSGFIPKKIKSGLQIGSFFTTTSGYGSGFTTYISPYISYPFSSKFRVNAGITILNASYYGIKPYYLMNSESSLNGNFTNAMVYVSGEYLVNERLSVSGTLFKSFNILSSAPSDRYHPNYDAQGAFMKVGYKVFENFQIEAGFGYSKGIDPFNSYFGSPIIHSPFIR